jgi:hypothetical protein
MQVLQVNLSWNSKPKPSTDEVASIPNPGPIRVWAGPGQAKPSPVPYLVVAKVNNVSFMEEEKN